MKQTQNLSLQNMPEETWKDITGYNGQYQVSNFGRIKSISRTSPGKFGSTRTLRTRILRHRIRSKGYHAVTLYFNDVKQVFSVTRLVAEAFVPNPYNKPQVDHIDNDKDNNTASNLRWVTSKENMNNPISIKNRKQTWSNKFPPKAKQPDRRERSVYAFNPTTKEIRRYSTMKETTRDGFNPKSVSRVCHHGRKTTNGWMFFLADDSDIKSYLPKVYLSPSHNN